MMKGTVGCGQDTILPVGRDDSARRYPVAIMINGIVGCGWLMIPLAMHSFLVVVVTWARAAGGVGPYEM